MRARPGSRLLSPLEIELITCYMSICKSAATGRMTRSSYLARVATLLHLLPVDLDTAFCIVFLLHMTISSCRNYAPLSSISNSMQFIRRALSLRDNTLFLLFFL